MSEIILDNDNYEVSYWNRSSNNVTVVFSSAGALALAQPVEEFRNTIKNFNTSYIFVRSKHLDWYNNPNSVKMFRFLDGFCKKYQFIYSMGESLGASGALLFSKYCEKITRIMAFSPQYSALPAFCKWFGPLSPLDGAISTFAFSDYAPESAASKAVLIYPSCSYEDNLHAKFYKSENFNVVTINTRHHDIARHLKKDYGTNYLNIVLDAFYNNRIAFSADTFEKILCNIVEYSPKSFVKWIGNQTFKYDHFIELPNFHLVSHDGKATQSSVCEYSFHRDSTEAEAQRAIDEPLRMIPAFHTGFEKNPWWSIELKQPAHIKQIIIFNRCDNEEFARRFNKFSLLKSDDGMYWEEFYEKNDARYIGGEFGEPLQIETDFTARYIKIFLNETNFLHLSRVSIYGNYL
ncbi:discoidin domain-containing protein [Gluconobacter japonicus]|uniref:discoidin domain-containing protein n=1 Tax=Gluconobacter japonicus TaxID=376620 RepID=UPI0024AE8281|nr:discoidin domain-containing protein [Gluconobacter japonicus]MDI6652175.1 discoidin domain-containing protein [Gluconobacter japonicus]